MATRNRNITNITPRKLLKMALEGGDTQLAKEIQSLINAEQSLAKLKRLIREMKKREA